MKLPRLSEVAELGLEKLPLFLCSLLDVRIGTRHLVVEFKTDRSPRPGSNKTEIYKNFTVQLTLTYLLLIGQPSFVELNKEVLSPFVVIW